MLEQFDWLRYRIRKLFTPRPKTDLESEILNIVSAPIYVFTITGVYYYSWVYVMPYYYTNSIDIAGDEKLETVDNDNEGYNVILFLQRALLTLIYFEMMSNWLCIRYVSNRPNTSNKQSHLENGVGAVVSAEVNGNNHIKLTNGNIDAATSDTQAINSHNGKPDEKLKKRQSIQNTNIVVNGQANGQKRSYWSWHECVLCNHMVPPRCHHCPLCETCVLKRDHHCFFSGRCVGFYNQRYFVVFLIWAVFGTSFSTLFFIPYLLNVLWPSMFFLDIFPPFSLLRWMFGTGSGLTTAILFTFLFNFLFVFLSSTFLMEQYSLVCSGLTQFESKGLNRQKLDIVDPRSLKDRVRAVIGRNYGISLFIPMMHLLLPPCENPYDWPDLNIIRKTK